MRCFFNYRTLYKEFFANYSVLFRLILAGNIDFFSKIRYNDYIKAFLKGFLRKTLKNKNKNEVSFDQSGFALPDYHISTDVGIFY